MIMIMIIIAKNTLPVEKLQQKNQLEAGKKEKYKEKTNHSNDYKSSWCRNINLRFQQ